MASPPIRVRRHRSRRLRSPATSEAPTDEPSPADEDEALAVLSEIEEQVIAIRGLPAADIGAPELLTRDELPGRAAHPP